MAKVGFMGLTWVDAKGRKRGTKFNWHTDAKRLIGAAAAVALQKAGMEVRRRTQRQMVGGSTSAGRKLRANPVWWRVGEKDGYPVVAYVRKVPHVEKVSSWAPRAFLRNDVQSDYDAASQSVVVGPSKFPWLNKLHEVGGPVGVYVNHTKDPVKQFGGHDVPKKHQRSVSGSAIVAGRRVRRGRTYLGAYVGVFNNRGGNFRVGTRQLRGRAYMEIGLQASMHKIPAQFRDTIRYGRVKKIG